jgi:hypothetical protein
MMQHSACISKLVSPQGLLGEVQFLCVKLIMPASFLDLEVKLPFNLMKHHAMSMYGSMEIWSFMNLILAVDRASCCSHSTCRQRAFTHTV